MLMPPKGYKSHHFQQPPFNRAMKKTQGWDENAKSRHLFVWKMNDSGPLTAAITDYSPFPAQHVWCVNRPDLFWGKSCA